MRRSTPLACRFTPIHAALRFGTPAVRWAHDSSQTECDKPTISDAEHMPRHFYEMTNDVLQVLSGQGNEGARTERLVREIMSVDNVSWDDAQARLNEIRDCNQETSFIETLPYKVGIIGATGIGLATFPLCFHQGTVEWFNEGYVTMEVPEAGGLDTVLEVGSWSWNWMEPPLGQLSFVLLCLQFSRAQMHNIGARPFTGMVQSWKQQKLIKTFPDYEQNILAEFAVSDSKLLTEA